MAKLSGWLITIIGVLMVLPLVGVALSATLNSWLLALLFLALGVSKLIRNYSK